MTATNTPQTNNCHPCGLRRRGEIVLAEHYESARAKQVVAAGISGDQNTLRSTGREIGACPECRTRFDGFILRLCAGAFVAAFGGEAEAIAALRQPIFDEDLGTEITEIEALPTAREHRRL